MSIFNRRSQGKDLAERLGAREDELRASTLYRDAWIRLKKNKLALFAFAAIVVIVIIAIFAPLIAPYAPETQDLKNRNQGPSDAHLLGTDSLGRDLLSRIIHGSRVSLMVGIITECIAVPLGVLLGSIAGYYGGKIDAVISRIIETLSSFPFILFAMVLMYVFGTGLVAVFVALGIIGWIGLARLIRGQVIQLKEREFVEAARAAGASDLTIIFKHLIPNCLSTIIVVITLDIPDDIVYEATLSFIGLGVQPPMPSWGSMLAESMKYMRDNPGYAIYPGLALMFLVLMFNTLGDGLRDALDPKLKNL
ncbi:MAG: ABC transporter permease [Symbiobacteriaceae bacterium]|nr:ABC transporter permease [Symbiobacteriaceae bacterium]